MSDDTPTQRFPEPGSDAPTRRLGTPAGTPAGAATGPDGELVDEKKSRALLITLVSVGAALLIAIVVLLIILFGNNGDAGPGPTPSGSSSESTSPSPSPTASESTSPPPSPTPTPTPTQTEEPEPEPPSAIVSYRVSLTEVDCSSGNPVPLTFNWNTTGQSVSFGVGTDSADTAPYQQDLPAVGGITIDYQCPQPDGEETYSIAVFHNGSVIARETITVSE